MDRQLTGYSTNFLEQNLAGKAGCPSGDEELYHPLVKTSLYYFSQDPAS